jgi:hypothetical protein
MKTKILLLIGIMFFATFNLSAQITSSRLAIAMSGKEFVSGRIKGDGGKINDKLYVGGIHRYRSWFLYSPDVIDEDVIIVGAAVSFYVYDGSIDPNLTLSFGHFNQ